MLRLTKYQLPTGKNLSYLHTEIYSLAAKICRTHQAKKMQGFNTPSVSVAGTHSKTELTGSATTAKVYAAS